MRSERQQHSRLCGWISEIAWHQWRWTRPGFCTRTHYLRAGASAGGAVCLYDFPSRQHIQIRAAQVDVLHAHAFCAAGGVRKPTLHASPCNCTLMHASTIMVARAAHGHSSLRPCLVAGACMRSRRSACSASPGARVLWPDVAPRLTCSCLLRFARGILRASGRGMQQSHASAAVACQLLAWKRCTIF